MKTLHTILCFVFSVTVLFSCAGCNTKETQIDWSLQGTWVTEDGILRDTIEFSITGNVPTDAAPDGSLQYSELCINWPETFTYANPEEQTFAGNAYISENAEAPVVFVMNGTAHNCVTTLPVGMTLFLCPEKEYIIFNGATLGTDIWLLLPPPILIPKKSWHISRHSWICIHK